MNTLVLSILVILFIIVIFFSFKYFADLHKINAITNKNTEHFYFSESENLPNTNLIVSMKKNLGFPLPLDSEPENIDNVDVLSNYYNASSHNSGNFTCYTKYLGLFRLVTLNQELQANPNANPMALADGSNSFTISFNDSLENSFYGGDSTVPENIEKKECWCVQNRTNTSDGTNKTKYFDQLESYLSILDKPVEKPKINNFIIDDEDEILNFLNFGTKTQADGPHINYYVKNARYLLTKDQQVTIVNNYLENRIYGTLENGLQFENYILRAVIGERNGLNNDLNGFLYYLVNLFNNDLSTIQTTSAENNPYNLFDIIAQEDPNKDDDSEDTISTTASNHNENIYKSLRYQLYVDSTIYYMEKLYARLALEASNNEAVIETILCPGDKCDTLTYEDFNEILINALNTDTETSRTTAAESSNIDLSVSIGNVELNLTYYYYIVILLLKLRTKIIKDNFMEKFNCKYMSFLFYSFRMGWKVFGDYIYSVFSKYEAAILKDVFFELGDFEGLYKLFILSIKQGECNVFYEFETDKNMKKIGITLQRVLPDNNVEGDDLKLALDFNTRAFSFYHETGDIKSLCAGFNSAATCIPELTDSMCMWDSSGDGECVPVPRLKTNCFEASGQGSGGNRPDACDSTECRWDSDNKICKPKDCANVDGNCETDLNHCEMKSNMAGDRRSSAVQAGIQDRCYDNLRVMYMTSSETDSDEDNVQTSTTQDMNVPSFFFRGSTRRPLSHLDTCVQEVYNDSTNSYKPHQNAEERCSQSPNINCKYLNSTLNDSGNSHNNTEYRTCVSDELISPDSFYTCGTIKDERECDFNVKHNLDCFWQDGKCFNRDAPLHWRNPSGSKYGLEDSTNCNNFGSEFECPSNRCVWLGTGSTPCINKEDHPYYETAPQETQPAQVSVIPLIKEKIDCEAVNHEHNLDNDKKRTECHALRCNYDHVNNICKSNVGNSCALRHNRESCILNPLENYDPISEQNMCRWSENHNIELDTNTLGNGYCTDTRMLQPCGLFDASKCPIEEKRDTMGNIIENSNHCKIQVNLEDGSQSCVNNINSNFNGKETFNHCHYDYLNTGICDRDNCRQLNLKNIDGSTVVNKCVPKERLPCSTLSMEECNNSNIVGTGRNKICEYNPSIERCETNETYESLIDKLQDATNRSDDDYYEINKMKDKLNNVDSLINENKQHYIKEEGLISGRITKIKKNGSGTTVINRNKIVLKTNSTLINRLTKGDFISIKRVDNHNNIEASISEYEILDINLVDKEITINVDNISTSTITIDTTPRNPNPAIYWTMKNPSKGLFGSYQHAQTIMDAIKINDFYNNFF